MMIDHVSKHYTLDPLGEGLYAAIASNGGSAIANAGLVDLGGGTLIIDTFLTPTAAEDLRAGAQRLTGQIPRWVINTHYHNDHIWGNQVFLPEADIISTAETRALIQTDGKQEYDEYRAITPDRFKNFQAQYAGAQTDEQRAALDLWIGYFGGLARDFPRLHVTLPNLTFENRMALHGARRRAELIEFKGAHTGSDTVIYLPDDGVVFMSDLLFIDFHPYLGNGDPDRWLAVLRSILDGSAGIQAGDAGELRFVPGHGPVGTLADLRGLADYIQECQMIARRLSAEGANQEVIVSTPIPEAYAAWSLAPFFYANLRFLVEKYQRRGEGQVERRGSPVSTSLGS